jgi:hypothetical protein
MDLPVGFEFLSLLRFRLSGAREWVITWAFIQRYVRSSYACACTSGGVEASGYSQAVFGQIEVRRNRLVKIACGALFDATTFRAVCTRSQSVLRHSGEVNRRSGRASFELVAPSLPACGVA